MNAELLFECLREKNDLEGLLGRQRCLQRSVKEHSHKMRILKRVWPTCCRITLARTLGFHILDLGTEFIDGVPPLLGQEKKSSPSDNGFACSPKHTVIGGQGHSKTKKFNLKVGLTGFT